MTVNNVSLLNVLDVSPLDVSMWLGANILGIRVPESGPNTAQGINVSLVPLMSEVTNRILVVTEMYVIVVGATPPYDNKSKDGNAASQDLNKKKDVLYRTLQSMEATRDTIGRMITAATQSIRANLA